MNEEDCKKTATGYAKFLIENRQNFLKNYREEFQQLIQYCQTLMSILGILAGFGFSAYESIKYHFLFFSGELFVLFSIVYLIYQTESFLTGQPASTENWINDSIEKVRQIKAALISEDRNAIQGFAQEFNNSVTDVSTAIPQLNAAKKVGANIKVALLCGIAGILFIIASFIF